MNEKTLWENKYATGLHRVNQEAEAVFAGYENQSGAFWSQATEYDAKRKAENAKANDYTPTDPSQVELVEPSPNLSIFEAAAQQRAREVAAKVEAEKQQAAQKVARENYLNEVAYAGTEKLTGIVRAVPEAKSITLGNTALNQFAQLQQYEIYNQGLETLGIEGRVPTPFEKAILDYYVHGQLFLKGEVDHLDVEASKNKAIDLYKKIDPAWITEANVKLSKLGLLKPFLQSDAYSAQSHLAIFAKSLGASVGELFPGEAVGETLQAVLLNKFGKHKVVSELKARLMEQYPEQAYIINELTVDDLLVEYPSAKAIAVDLGLIALDLFGGAIVKVGGKVVKPIAIPVKKLGAQAMIKFRGYTDDVIQFGQQAFDEAAQTGKDLLGSLRALYGETIRGFKVGKDHVLGDVVQLQRIDGSTQNISKTEWSEITGASQIFQKSITNIDQIKNAIFTEPAKLIGAKINGKVLMSKGEGWVKTGKALNEQGYVFRNENLNREIRIMARGTNQVNKNYNKPYVRINEIVNSSDPNRAARALDWEGNFLSTSQSEIAHPLIILLEKLK